MDQKMYQLSQVADNDDVSDLEDEIDYDHREVFDAGNIDFINFKKDVKDWLTLDDDIITLQKAIKERKNKKNNLTPKILDFMDKFQINDLNTNEGTLKFSKTMYTKPLNKQFLISRLGDFFKDFSKGEKAASFILDNRDKEEKLKLRRVVNKKSIKI
jgi:hypothetical protein